MVKKSKYFFKNTPETLLNLGNFSHAKGQAGTGRWHVSLKIGISHLFWENGRVGTFPSCVGTILISLFSITRHHWAKC